MFFGRTRVGLCRGRVRTGGSENTSPSTWCWRRMESTRISIWCPYRILRVINQVTGRTSEGGRDVAESTLEGRISLFLLR